MTERELTELKKSAEAGDAEAQYGLACYYSEQAQAKRDALSQEILSGSPMMRWPSSIGERNYFDRIVEEEYAEAFRLFECAARQGHLGAIYELSLCYASGKGTALYPEKARLLLKEAAEKGYAPAQYDLGMLTYFGKPKGPNNLVEVKPDYIASVKWFKRAAEQNYPLAQYYLGVCYEEGKGVEQDFFEAFRLFERAAEAGLLWAACALGRCYELGRGTNIDLERALKWYAAAAESGDAEAAEALERLKEE